MERRGFNRKGLDKKGFNRKGLQMAISTVVVMILGIVVLTFLVMFFTMGAGGFLEAVKGYFSYSNVDSVVSSCDIFVDSGQVNSYCCDSREVKYVKDGEKLEGLFSCDELVDEGFNVKELNCEGVC